MDQRQGDPLGDDGDVVRVSEEAVRATLHQRQPGYDDHPGVPLHPERSDAPPPQGMRREEQDEHRPCQRGYVGGPEHQDLDQAADQQTCVQRDHDGVVPGASLHAAVPVRPHQVPPGDPELDEPGHDHHRDEDDVQAAAAREELAHRFTTAAGRARRRSLGPWRA